METENGYSPLQMPEREPSLLTFDEFLQLEETATVKHEFVQGYRYEMSGAREAHSQIVVNASVLLHTALRGSECRVFGSDMLVHVAEADAGFYPDLHVVCREQRDPQARTHPRATVIVEILSKSTMRYDRGNKFEHYRKLASLRHYVLIDSTARNIEVRTRANDDTFAAATYESGAFTLDAIGVTLSLDELYEDSGV